MSKCPIIIPDCRLNSRIPRFDWPLYQIDDAQDKNDTRQDLRYTCNIIHSESESPSKISWSRFHELVVNATESAILKHPSIISSFQINRKIEFSENGEIVWKWIWISISSTLFLFLFISTVVTLYILNKRKNSTGEFIITQESKTGIIFSGTL